MNETVHKLKSEKRYPIYMHKIGGSEPDGSPTMIDRWTFSTKMVRDVVLQHIEGDVLNACAGETKLRKKGVDIHRNDINIKKDADTYFDVCEIDEYFDDGSFDCAILDPPFDPGRADALYKGMHAKDYMGARNAVANLVRRGGRVIELGWNSWSLADKDAWQRVEHHMYRQPAKGDIHLTIDEKVQATLGDGTP